MTSTTDLSTITKRGIALEPVESNGSRTIARVASRCGDGLIVEILTGAYRATLDADGRLTTERDGETIDLGLHRIVWHGSLPGWTGESCEATSDIAQDFVQAELAAGRHGIVERADMPVLISRRALQALVNNAEGRMSMSRDLYEAMIEGQKALA
jgi:hypothetical protein